MNLTRGRANEVTPPRGFCAAPWLEAVIRIDGNVLPCCRTSHVLGNMEGRTLAAIWNDGIAQEFRATIGAGRFPSTDCERCYADGKPTTLYKTFDDLVARYWSTYAAACKIVGREPNPRLCEAIGPFHELVRQTTRNGGSGEPCRRVIFAIFACRRHPIPATGRTALRQLRKVARTCLDFIEGQPRPKLVATMREANLVAVCNARCIHCIGFHTGEIVQGEESGGRRFKRMTTDQARSALARPGDMTLFFMNGSEFLLHPEWREVVERFAARGVLLSFATNGMLLTSAASKLLVASNVLRDVNFSFDGGTRETVEAVRGNVRYDVLIEHAREFLHILDASGSRITVSLSMVLLAANVAEAPALVRLVDALRGGRNLDMHASFQLLNLADNPSYQAFYGQQRVDIHHPTARAHLIEAAQIGEALGVPTYYSYTGTLRTALAGDYRSALYF
jgi:radical SAM protein with 4Fe4S-binding SPASM domain